MQSSVEVLGQPGAEQRCRFPARYRYLAEALGWQEAEPFAHCGEYQTWRAGIPDASVVLVFPAAYLNSPSSMFGHTLLRFDAADQQSDWHAWAVNFGALVTADDNSIFYIYRGLAGVIPDASRRFPMSARSRNTPIWKIVTCGSIGSGWMPMRSAG